MENLSVASGTDESVTISACPNRTVYWTCNLANRPLSRTKYGLCYKNESCQKDKGGFFSHGY